MTSSIISRSQDDYRQDDYRTTTIATSAFEKRTMVRPSENTQSQAAAARNKETQVEGVLTQRISNVNSQSAIDTFRQKD
jgi:hypothetical protein